jgi:GH15 family glucan-1,4-alpha-glucosidase
VAYQPIENYGVIGDLHTVALVGMNGSIDFLCFPLFDSPSVFAALLDDRRGGRFQIAPALESVRCKQLYLPDTNVLLTRFLSGDGVGEVMDFMPITGKSFAHDLVRRVKTVRGELRFRLLCQPRFDYGRAKHRVHAGERSVLFVSQGSDGTALRLRSQVPLEVKGGDVHAEFSLRAGECADFILERAEEGAERPALAAEDVSDYLDATSQFWRRWVGGSNYRGRWQDTVNRSALALKLLFSQPYGALVAAPTFGLPEAIGGTRNWDYRYMWIRDSAFTLFTLGQLGFTEEAGAFMHWLQHCGRVGRDGGDSGPLQIMYGLDGRRNLSEEILSHFEGYRGSSPVRIGNAAYAQLQLDIYGELLDAIYLFNRHGAPIAYDLWRDISGIVDWVAEHWQEPDEGIWEVRGGRQEFLYSRLMCWVALDRAVRIAWNRSFPGTVDRWLTARDAVFADIYENFWNAERGAFVQYKGATWLDASSLLMPIVHLISFTEPRWLSHLKAVEDELVDDSLVYRYREGQAAPDGLTGNEGTFSMCSFWYVENLARCGRLEEARFYFEKMLGFANHLGLYSEQLGPTGEHLGNFPQAFTHLALISAAIALDRGLSLAGQRA